MDRYINANLLIKDIELSRANNNHNNAIASQTHNAEHRHFIKMVLDQPTADMVEVVRCKDCKYCFHYIRPNYERYECEYYGTSDEVVDYVEPMHYCSYGKKKID